MLQVQELPFEKPKLTTLSHPLSGGILIAAQKKKKNKFLLAREKKKQMRGRIKMSCRKLAPKPSVVSFSPTGL